MLYQKEVRKTFVQHASTIGLPEKFQSQSVKYNDMYLEEPISKTIIFRELEKIVSQADWYEVEEVELAPLLTP